MKWICRLSLLALLMCASRAGAVGWGPTDFLIGGGPSFTDRIGVFDQNLNFKGYLETNFLTVAGMDFDSQGRLVAVAGALREVRVYDSSGARSGGFVRKDDLLGSSADIKVAPNGNYIVGAQNFGGGDGAREFAPDGTFVRQYGSGGTRGIAVVQGTRLWTGAIGSSTISSYDLTSGSSADDYLIQGMANVFSMTYSQITDTILSNSGAKIWEIDTAGASVRTFDGQGKFVGASVRGPNADVFGTTGTAGLILKWHSDGSFVSSTTTPSGFGGAWIVWAGNVPEPGPALTLATLLTTFLASRRSRERFQI
jgi:hypothetical protein